MTSKFLGSNAYSAISLLMPFTAAVLLLANFASTGSQILLSRLIGEGKNEEANSVFSISVLLGVFIAIFIVMFGVFFPDILIRICGASLEKTPELYPHMREYLNGYVFGIPALIMVQVISPIILIDSGKRVVSISAVFLCASDIVGDFWNVYVWHGGVFGMGFVTSISLILQFLILCFHFLRRTNHISFTTKGLKREYVIEILWDGMPRLAKNLATTLRDFLINRFNLWVAITIAAVAAKGIQNDISALMFCAGFGIGKTLLLMTSMYFGANDQKGLKQLFSYFVKFSVKLSIVMSVVVFACAPMIVHFYTDNPEVIALSIFSIRCVAISFVFDTLSVSFQDYLQAVKQRKLVVFLTFAERFFLPVLLALVLGSLFGSRGILAAVPVSKCLLVVILFGMVCYRCMGFPKSWEDFMFLPDGFGGEEKENLYVQIQTMDDVARESKRTEQFCQSRGLRPEQVKRIVSLVEVLAGDILTYGKSKGKKGICIDYRLAIEGGRFWFTMRDFCKEYNPISEDGQHHDKRMGEYSGSQIVAELGAKSSYMFTLNSNYTVVQLRLPVMYTWNKSFIA